MTWTVIDLDNLTDPMPPTFETLMGAQRYLKRYPGRNMVACQTRMAQTARDMTRPLAAL